MLMFAARNRKEVLRDPLTLAFILGFPIVLILLISMLQRSISEMPVDLFGIENFAPGMAVFGISFLPLFIGMLMVNDKNSSFLTRLFASPLRASDFILGYSLPFLPIALADGVICLLFSAIFGLELGWNLLLACAVLIPVSAFYIAIGLLLGACLSSSPQVGGAGSILINVAAWLSGTWFDLQLIGGVFETVCNLLPFVHAVNALKAVFLCDYAEIIPNLIWVVAYTLIVLLAAIICFHKKMRR